MDYELFFFLSKPFKLSNGKVITKVCKGVGTFEEMEVKRIAVAKRLKVSINRFEIVVRTFKLKMYCEYCDERKEVEILNYCYDDNRDLEIIETYCNKCDMVTQHQ